jgi:hypothetical protein
MSLMAQVCGLILCLFVGALGLTIIIWIWIGKIDLSALLNEANGQASMSRFQLLIFTFVIAISLFELVEMRANPTGFPDIPNGVLTLLGISASTYAVGKGISYSQPQMMIAQSTGGNGGDGGDTADAVATAQAAASQAAVHAATAQQAAQQTATNAAKAQQAADQATGTPP